VNINNTTIIGKIKIIRINLHNCKNASSTLSQYMLENEIDLTLVQEPYLINEKVALFPLHFQILQPTGRSRSAIVINPKRVRAMVLEKYTNQSIVWSIIRYKYIDAYVSSIYLAPSQPIIESIDKLTQDLNELKPKYLIVGATQTRSRSFGSIEPKIKEENI
jgi:hypothetical protein